MVQAQDPNPRHFLSIKFIEQGGARRVLGPVVDYNNFPLGVRLILHTLDSVPDEGIGIVARDDDGNEFSRHDIRSQGHYFPSVAFHGTKQVTKGEFQNRKPFFSSSAA